MRAALPLDPVARFHLGNGARLEQIHFLADGIGQRRRASRYGIMVNYLYDLDDIEKNHEAYAENRTVVASNAVKTPRTRGPRRARSAGRADFFDRRRREQRDESVRT